MKFGMILKIFFEHGTPKIIKQKSLYNRSLEPAATIAAFRLGTFARGCFTFGPPRAGNNAFTKTIKCPVGDLETNEI